MSYVKQNFQYRQKLRGKHLNHIEDGIAELEKKIMQLEGGVTGFGGVVHTEVSGLSVASYKTNSGVNYYSCTYGKNLTVSSAGTLTVDEKLTATSAYSLENLKSALLGNYLVSGSSIYYIPEDATFTTSSNTANYITTNTLRVNKAYLVSTTDEVIDSYRGNATAEDIVKGKKAVVDGELLDGTHAEPIVTLTNGVLSIV